MKRLLNKLTGVMVLAFAMAGFGVQPAAAQDKAKEMKSEKAEKGKATVKVLFENDKVRVVEATFKPGDEGPNTARPFRIVRPLKGGTLQRTWADGKVDKIEFKTNEVKALDASAPYTPKNVGKSDVVLYVVNLKEPKK